LNLTQGQQFVVLHQSAAHEVYIDAVPPDFRKKFDQISDYQMAVNYVEYVWQKIMDVLANTTAPTYVFFTADHSEAQMETGGKKGHCFFSEDVIVVPFLYTTLNIENDAYREKIPSNNLLNHTYISKLIAFVLGYEQNLNVDKTYYINGMNEMGMEGILEVETDGDKILKTEIKTMDIFYKKLNF
jgi:glucan phosphoethanolaminetransferase (alkaline phosphatase superfamily)